MMSICSVRSVSALSVLINMKIVLICPNWSVLNAPAFGTCASLCEFSGAPFCVTSRVQSYDAFGARVCTLWDAYIAGQCLPWRQKSIQNQNKPLLNKNGNRRSKQFSCAHCSTEKMSWCLSQCRFLSFSRILSLVCCEGNNKNFTLLWGDTKIRFQWCKETWKYPVWLNTFLAIFHVIRNTD